MDKKPEYGSYKDVVAAIEAAKHHPSNKNFKTIAEVGDLIREINKSKSGKFYLWRNHWSANTDIKLYLSDTSKLESVEPMIRYDSYTFVREFRMFLSEDKMYLFYVLFYCAAIIHRANFGLHYADRYFLDVYLRVIKRWASFNSFVYLLREFTDRGLPVPEYDNRYTIGKVLPHHHILSVQNKLSQEARVRSSEIK